jgi:hypothetical protein
LLVSLEWQTYDARCAVTGRVTQQARVLLDQFTPAQPVARNSDRRASREGRDTQNRNNDNCSHQG